MNIVAEVASLNTTRVQPLICSCSPSHLTASHLTSAFTAPSSSCGGLSSDDESYDFSSSANTSTTSIPSPSATTANVKKAQDEDAETIFVNATPAQHNQWCLAEVAYDEASPSPPCRCRETPLSISSSTSFAKPNMPLLAHNSDCVHFYISKPPYGCRQTTRNGANRNWRRDGDADYCDPPKLPKYLKRFCINSRCRPATMVAVALYNNNENHRLYWQEVCKDQACVRANRCLFEETCHSGSVDDDALV